MLSSHHLPTTCEACHKVPFSPHAACNSGHQLLRVQLYCASGNTTLPVTLQDIASCNSSGSLPSTPPPPPSPLAPPPCTNSNSWMRGGDATKDCDCVAKKS